MPAPVTFEPAGYQIDLDYIPSDSSASCGKLFLLIGAAIGVVTIVLVGVIALISPPEQHDEFDQVVPLTLVPTFTPRVDPTLDNWALTGTALAMATASPTMDYCWFLTPSPVPSMTPIPVTPDSWALQGTQIALQTGTPTHTPTPTQAPPRVWCNMYVPVTPTPLPSATITDTPMSDIVPMYFVSPTPRPTDLPTLTISRQSPQQPPVIQQPIQQFPTSIPQIIVETVVITQPPPPSVTPWPTPTPLPTSTPAYVLRGHCERGYPFFEAFVAPLPLDWVQWAIESHTGYVAAGVWDYSTPYPIQSAAATGWGEFTLEVFRYWADDVIGFTVDCPAPTPTWELPTATPTWELPTATPTWELPTATPTELPTATPTELPTITASPLPDLEDLMP